MIRPQACHCPLQNKQYYKRIPVLNKSFNPYLLPPLLLQWSALSFSDTPSCCCRNNQNFCLPISDALKKSIEEIPNSIHSTKEIRISATTANNKRRKRASERARERESERVRARGRADGRERERKRERKSDRVAIEKWPWALGFDTKW
jgi:hypothetical protein